MRSHKARRALELFGGGLMVLSGFAGLLFVAADPERLNWFYTGVAVAGAGALLDRSHNRLKPALQVFGAGLMVVGFLLRAA